VYHARTKHIDVRFHLVREVLDEGDIELQKIHKKETPADMLTKVIPRVKFRSYSISLQLFMLGGAHFDKLRMTLSSWAWGT